MHFKWLKSGTFCAVLKRLSVFTSPRSSEGRGPGRRRLKLSHSRGLELGSQAFPWVMVWKQETGVGPHHREAVAILCRLKVT